jgi:hypothetical protein
MKRLIGCVAGTLCLACQTYSAVPFTAVRPGNAVRLTVTNDGSMALVPAIGRNVASLEGRVRSLDSSGVTVLVERVNRGTDIDEYIDTSTVRLAPGEVSAAELRKVDKPRSFILAGLITAGALLAAQSTGTLNFFGSTHGGTGSTK